MFDKEAVRIPVPPSTRLRFLPAHSSKRLLPAYKRYIWLDKIKSDTERFKTSTQCHFQNPEEWVEKKTEKKKMKPRNTEYHCAYVNKFIDDEGDGDSSVEEEALIAEPRIRVKKKQPNSAVRYNNNHLYMLSERRKKNDKILFSGNRITTCVPTVAPSLERRIRSELHVRSHRPTNMVSRLRFRPGTAPTPYYVWKLKKFKIDEQVRKTATPRPPPPRPSREIRIC